MVISVVSSSYGGRSVKSFSWRSNTTRGYGHCYLGADVRRRNKWVSRQHRTSSSSSSSYRSIRSRPHAVLRGGVFWFICPVAGSPLGAARQLTPSDQPALLQGGRRLSGHPADYLAAGRAARQAKLLRTTTGHRIDYHDDHHPPANSTQLAVGHPCNGFQSIAALKHAARPSWTPRRVWIIP